jgi:formylglycine-generating enzyme required for sulfatase activity
MKLRWSVGVVAVLVLLVAFAVCFAQTPSALDKPGTKVGDTATGPDGGVYVWVPAGEFDMGAEDLGDAAKPVHHVRITKGFWLSKFLTTNEQYARFLTEFGSEKDDDGNALIDLGKEIVKSPEGGYRAKAGRRKHPLVCVSWHGALAYCEHYGLELPTEAQWEYSARGPEGRKYPWGDKWDPGKCCNGKNAGNGRPPTMVVGRFPSGAAWCGALDMAGNVAEWCQDWYDEHYYDGSPVNDPRGSASGQYRTLRGGSWYAVAGYCRCAFRSYGVPTNRYGDGFRASRTP